jgi:hypothetical protein
MWHSDQYVFEQFIIRGKGFDTSIFEILEVKPPSADHAYWEIDFQDGVKMITTESVSLQFRERGKEEEGGEEKIRSIRIG